MSVIVLPPTDEAFGRGISQAGSALGQALEKYGQRRREEKGATTLQDILSGLGDNPTPQAIASAYTQAIAQGAPTSLVEKLGGVYTDLMKSQPKNVIGMTKPGELSGILQQFGLPKDAADRYDALYPTLSTGAKTTFANMIMDQLSRSGGFSPIAARQPQMPTQSQPSQIQPGMQPQGMPQLGEQPIPQLGLPSQPQQPAQPEFQFPQVNPFQGLTPKEQVERQKELYTENTKNYQDADEKLESFEAAGRSIQILNNLNESKELPEGLGRLQINMKTGELLLPALANANTQLYVKTVNEFLKGAREQFGARVSNFELDKFMAQLPTLANTYEGRRLILEQMRILNSLKQIKQKSLLDTYAHYGSRAIDPIKAKEIAKEKVKNEEKYLIKQLDQNVRGANSIVSGKESFTVIAPDGRRFNNVPKEEVEKFRNIEGVKIQ